MNKLKKWTTNLNSSLRKFTPTVANEVFEIQGIISL